jgi:hypothetical protein
MSVGAASETRARLRATLVSFIGNTSRRDGESLWMYLSDASDDGLARSAECANVSAIRRGHTDDVRR